MKFRLSDPGPDKKRREPRPRQTAREIVIFAIWWGIIFAIATGVLDGDSLSRIAANIAFAITFMAILKFAARAIADVRQRNT